MNPNTIRKIDYWFGQPICFLLSFFNFSSHQKSKPSKIVFLKFIEQGATILAYPAIKRAVELVGKQNVYFCVFDNNRPVLDILDIIPPENIITIREKNIFSFLFSALSALIKIRKKNIDTSIDMEFFSRASAIFSFLTGARIRVGLHRFTSELPYRGNLMSYRIQYNHYAHISDFYYSLVEAVLQDPSEIPMMKVSTATWYKEVRQNLAVFIPTEKEKNEVQEMINSAFGISTKKIIILNPNASDLLPLRKWDKNNFIELGKRIIAENPNACIALSGAPSEQKGAEEICAQIGSAKAISFAGKTTLRQLFTLYSLSDLLVTNDSGPGHFTSLTNIRTVVLFGPETPKLFGSLSPNAHIIWKELACSPCVNVFNHRFSPCNNNVCMQSITVDEVYGVVKQYLH